MSVPAAVNIPYILPRACCNANASGPSVCRWKEHTIKVVKLCDIFGLTDCMSYFRLGRPKDIRMSHNIGVGIAVAWFVIAYIAHIAVPVLCVIGQTFLFLAARHTCYVKLGAYGTMFITGSRKILTSFYYISAVALGYFASLAVISGVAAFILYKTQPSQEDYQRYVLRCLQAWLDSNQLEKVYHALSAPDIVNLNIQSQIRRTLIERLLERGCTDLSILDRLTNHMSYDEQDACYELIAKAIYEKEHDVKRVLAILTTHINNPAKKDELLLHYVQLQVEEGQLIHIGAQEVLSDLRFVRGLPELVMEYVSSPELEMAFMLANGMERAEAGPDRERILAYLAAFYQRNYHVYIVSNAHLPRNFVIFDQFLNEVNALQASGVIPPNVDQVECREIIRQLRTQRLNDQTHNVHLPHAGFCNALNAASQVLPEQASA